MLEVQTFSPNIQVFYDRYLKELRRWADEYMSNEENVSEKEWGLFNKPNIEYIVYCRMLADIEEQYDYYWEETKEARRMKIALIDPFREVEHEVRGWYERTWRKKYLDFASIPAAKHFVWEKKDNYHYSSGALNIEIVGSRQYREVKITVGNLLLWEFPIECKVSQFESFLLPRVKRLVALCDWSTYQSWSTPVKRAIGMRFMIIRDYYQYPDKYKYTLNKLKWYYIKQGKEVPDGK